MIDCPNCHAENRPGSRYCVNCSSSLPEAQTITQPLNGSTGKKSASFIAPLTWRLEEVRPGRTKPLGSKRPFLQRPEGAIFGDNYLSLGLFESGQDRYSYEVLFLDHVDDMVIRICPNPDCGAIFPPRNETHEMFCTDCGHSLVKGGKDLLLIETQFSIPDVIMRLASKGLSHGSIRAPLAAFVENIGDEVRNCLVTSKVQRMPPDLKGTFSIVQSLEMGASLARGLEYLHDNGFHFNGRIGNESIGKIGERAVWADFSGGGHHPDGYVTDRLPDTRSLALLVYFWLTGENQFSPDLTMTASLLRPFDLCITTDTVKTGAEFAMLLQDALDDVDNSFYGKIESYQKSDVGKVRHLNEDSLMTCKYDRTRQSKNQILGVFVVADGMGGHDSGEVASGLIVDAFIRSSYQDLIPAFLEGKRGDIKNWLRKTVETANRQVYDFRRSSGTDMGSTLVAAVIFGNRVEITHIGDSRAYLIHNHEISQLTTDHSLVERMIAANQISREDARRHPQRNVIYRTVGDKNNIEVDLIKQRLEDQDLVLLCSDGLSGMVEDEMIKQIIESAYSLKDACENLVRTANAAGGTDNISVILVRMIKN